MRHRLTRAATLALLVLAAGRPARAGDATGAWAPYEDLVAVVAELTWHLKDDVYRFPPPKDPTGHDVYDVALHRIRSWEKRFPSRLKDVAAFARAEALERLRAYEQAVTSYRQVAAMDSPLAPRAKDAADRLQPFAAAAALPEDGPDLDARLTALRAKLDAWAKVVDASEGTPRRALALVEEERLERDVAALVAIHRTDIKDGTPTAERALRFLIEKHADSQHLADHVLRLGDLYADIAREYAARHDRPLDFEEDAFVKLTDRALDVYRKVATWDGAREKPEGQARFAALDAFKSATLARYR